MKIKLWLGISTVVCILLLVRIYIVNMQYPQAQVKMAKAGEPLALGDYDVRLVSWEWKDSGILKEIAPDYTVMSDEDGSDYPEEKEKVAFAKLEIKKTTDEDKEFDLSTVALESGGWNNQWDAILYEELNGEDSLYMKMKKGESKEVILPIVLYDFQFHYKDWMKIDQRKFNIVFTNYPIKQMIVI